LAGGGSWFSRAAAAGGAAFKAATGGRKGREQSPSRREAGHGGATAAPADAPSPAERSSRCSRHRPPTSPPPDPHSQSSAWGGAQSSSAAASLTGYDSSQPATMPPPPTASRMSSAAVAAEHEAVQRRREARARQEEEQTQALRRVMRAHLKDHRTILGVPAGTLLDAKQVTKIFRQQSLLVHPDKNSAPEAEEAFKKLKTAYETMKEEVSNPRPAMAPSWSATPSAAGYGGVASGNGGYGVPGFRSSAGWREDAYKAYGSSPFGAADGGTAGCGHQRAGSSSGTAPPHRAYGATGSNCAEGGTPAGAGGQRERQERSKSSAHHWHYG